MQLPAAVRGQKLVEVARAGFIGRMFCKHGKVRFLKIFLHEGQKIFRVGRGGRRNVDLLRLRERLRQYARAERTQSADVRRECGERGALQKLQCGAGDGRVLKGDLRAVIDLAQIGFYTHDADLRRDALAVIGDHRHVRRAD